MADVLVTGLQGSGHLLWSWGKLAELETSGRTITEPACWSESFPRDQQTPEAIEAGVEK
jgi:hypothetical protein